MGTGDSKLSSDDETTNQEPKTVNFESDSQELNNLNSDRVFDDPKEKDTLTADDTQLHSTDDSSKEIKDLTAIFSKYLEDVKTKVNKSNEEEEDDDEDDDEEFEYSDFLKCSPSEMKACLKILIDFCYQNFDLFIFCRDVLFLIFMNARYRIQTKTAYWTTFNDIFEQEKEKIQKNTNWCDAVMFGALLTKLLVFHDPDNFVVTKHLKIWINELIKSSVEGNENALIAYMLVLRKLNFTINPYRGSFIQFKEVLMILLKDGESESKTKEVFEYLENCSQLDDYVPISIVKYKFETRVSKKCKYIKEFLTSDNDQTFFDINQLVFITSSEIEYFAKEFINVSIQKPHQIEFLTATAYRMQRTISTVQKIVGDIKEDIEHEIEIFKKNDGKSAISIINLSKFIGEISIHMGIMPTELLTSWLTLLSDMGETVALTATLKVNGWFYKLRKPEKFEEFRQSLGIFASEVDEEVAKVSQYFQKIENYDSEDITKYKISRHYQSAEGAKVIEDFELFMSELSKDKNVEYDYQNVYDIKNFYALKARHSCLREISKPTANVIKLAQFLKSFFTLYSNIATFLRQLKFELNNKIAEMPVDRPQELISIGKLISEMRNLTVTDKLPQDKWMCMIESLEPNENDKILEVYLDVLKVMMYNLYMFEEDKYKIYRKYINSIDTSNPKYSSKIKAKIAQITQNLIHKKINKSTRSLLFRVKSGWKVDSLPYDIPESSPTDFDLHDFVKLFFINATMNRYLMENYLKPMKFFTRGSRGQKFNSLLYSLSMDRFKNMLNPEYFDEDDAVAILQFVLLFYPQNIFSQHSLMSFFEDILAFEDFDDHKNCFRILLQLIKKDSMFRDFLKRKDPDSEVFKLLRKIQVKLIDVEVSVADDNEEVEVWHIVDYRGHSHDSIKADPIEPSQLAWSFTENYQENQQNNLKIVENFKKPAQNVDSLAQNFKDYTKNFDKIQHPGRSTRQFVATQDDQNNPNLNQNELNLNKNDQKSAFKIRILPESPQPAEQSTNYYPANQNFARRAQNSKIEWNVTRNNLRDRKDLQNADSKIFDRKT
ncbi:hypothetical protein ACKWTF_015530 [Chironomus riparius]